MSELIDFQELRQSAREMLAAECDSAALHRFIDGEQAVANKLWSTMAELGWQALVVPESYGGMGLDVGDLMAIYYELGRHCAPTPLLGSMLVAQALTIAGSEEQRALYLPKLASGEWRGAVGGLQQLSAPAALKLTAVGNDKVTLSGCAEHLSDATNADLLLLAARDAQGAPLLTLIETAADTVSPQPVAAVDLTRPFASVQIANLQLPVQRLLARGDAALNLGSSLLDHAALALACDSIGGAEIIFDATVGYLKTRKQFNRLIGSFQALKHRCADLKVSLEASGTSVEQAVQAMRGHSDSAGSLASMAKFYASDAYAHIAGEAMQLHGGIGFTWEHDCHLYLKRAKLNQALYGGSRWHQDRAARALVAQLSV